MIPATACDDEEEVAPLVSEGEVGEINTGRDDGRAGNVGDEKLNERVGCRGAIDGFAADKGGGRRGALDE